MISRSAIKVQSLEKVTVSNKKVECISNALISYSVGLYVVKFELNSCMAVGYLISLANKSLCPLVAGITLRYVYVTGFASYFHSAGWNERL